MGEDKKDSAPLGRSSAARGWLAFVALWLMFDAPQWIQAGNFSFLGLHPSADLSAVVALYLATHFRRISASWGLPMRIALALWAALLFLYAVDGAIWRALMRSDPLLYDQAVMLRHTLVLIGDLWTWRSFLIGVGILCGGLGLTWAARRLLLQVRASFLLPENERHLRGLFIACATLGVLGLVPADVGSLSPRWVTASFARNVRASAQMHAALEREIEASVYQGYRKIRLVRKPRIELFFVESYGRLLHDDPKLRPLWHERLRALEEDAREGGLSVASSFSEAPVSGGRSWIAEGSVLLGSPVRYEVVFRNLVEEIDRIPHLVGFLERQGYETVLLAPADRVRLGLENENRYSYDRTVTFDDLAYPGPAIGWGIIPDRYSLAHTKSRVLGSVPGPLFFNFHMVSSHAPWDQVPPWEIGADVEQAGSQKKSPSPTSVAETEKELSKRLRRLRRDGDHVFAHQGEVDSLGLEAYARAIFYELEVIGEHLREQHPDRLVIVMGDHQPPVVVEQNAGFEVPIHVFASDPHLLQDFLGHGFSRGIVPEADKAIRHEAIFSLVVRTLTRCCTEGDPLPAVQAHGVLLGR